MIRVYIAATNDEYSPTERDVLSELMAAKLEQHIAERAKYIGTQDSGAAANSAGNMLDAGQTTGPNNPALSPDYTCEDCHSLWFIDHDTRQCATHRRACEGCGREGSEVPLHSGEYSPKFKSLVRELWCESCDPTPPVGERFADFEADPWDLASEELVLTRELPRDERRGWSGDRSEYDPFDDKSDIEARSRTEKA